MYNTMPEKGFSLPSKAKQKKAGLVKKTAVVPLFSVSQFCETKNWTSPPVLWNGDQQATGQ